MIYIYIQSLYEVSTLMNTTMSVGTGTGSLINKRPILSSKVPRFWQLRSRSQAGGTLGGYIKPRPNSWQSQKGFIIQKSFEIKKQIAVGLGLFVHSKQARKYNQNRLKR